MSFLTNAGNVFTVEVVARFGGRCLALREHYAWKDALMTLVAVGDGDDVIGSITDERTNTVIVKVNPTGLIFDENRHQPSVEE